MNRALHGRLRSLLPRTVAAALASGLMASCTSPSVFPHGTNFRGSAGSPSVESARAHARGVFLAGEVPRPNAPMLFRVSVNEHGTTLQTAAGTTQLAGENIFRKTSSICLQGAPGGRRTMVLCGGTGDPTPTPTAAPVATPTPSKYQAISPIPTNLVQPDNNVIEVDYFQGSGANLFVYYNDGTMIAGSLVGSTLVFYHPDAPAGVWNLAFIDAVDHNVYLTAQRTGTLSPSSTMRMPSSSGRKKSEYDCVFYDVAGGVIGGVIGRVAGMEIGGDFFGVVGMLLGPEAGLAGALWGAVAGWAYGDLVGGAAGTIFAHWICKTFTSKDPPNGGLYPPTSGGGSYGVPPNDSSDNCWADPPPYPCVRRQAPVPL